MKLEVKYNSKMVPMGFRILCYVTLPILIPTFFLAKLLFPKRTRFIIN